MSKYKCVLTKTLGELEQNHEDIRRDYSVGYVGPPEVGKEVIGTSTLIPINQALMDQITSRDENVGLYIEINQ
jgi:hypothetical protein